MSFNSEQKNLIIKKKEFNIGEKNKIFLKSLGKFNLIKNKFNKEKEYIKLIYEINDNNYYKGIFGREFINNNNDKIRIIINNK